MVVASAKGGRLDFKVILSAIYPFEGQSLIPTTIYSDNPILRQLSIYIPTTPYHHIPITL